MAITRIFAIIRKEFIQITRDRRTLIFTLLMPLIQMVLLGYAANSDVKNVPLAVAGSEPHGAEPRAARRLSDDGLFCHQLRGHQRVSSGTPDRRGRGQDRPDHPTDFGQKVSRGQSVSVAFIIDGSDSSISAGSLAAAQLIGRLNRPSCRCSGFRARRSACLPRRESRSARGSGTTPTWSRRLS